MENQWSSAWLSSLPFIQGDEAEGGIRPSGNDTALCPPASGYRIEPSTHVTAREDQTNALATVEAAYSILASTDAGYNTAPDDNSLFCGFPNGVFPYSRSDNHVGSTQSRVSSGWGYDGTAACSTIDGSWSAYGTGLPPVSAHDSLSNVDHMLPIAPAMQTNTFSTFPTTAYPYPAPYLPVGHSSTMPPLMGPVLTGFPIANSTLAPGYPLLATDEPRFPCVHPGCTKDFKRRPDMTRHYRQVHDTQAVKQSCPWVGYGRQGANGFVRKDKLRDHQRAVHGAVL